MFLLTNQAVVREVKKHEVFNYYLNNYYDARNRYLTRLAVEMIPRSYADEGHYKVRIQVLNVVAGKVDLRSAKLFRRAWDGSDGICN